MTPYLKWWRWWLTRKYVCLAFECSCSGRRRAEEERPDQQLEDLLNLELQLSLWMLTCCFTYFFCFGSSRSSFEGLKKKAVSVVATMTGICLCLLMLISRCVVEVHHGMCTFKITHRWTDTQIHTRKTYFRYNLCTDFFLFIFWNSCTHVPVIPIDFLWQHLDCI